RGVGAHPGGDAGAGRPHDVGGLLPDAVELAVVGPLDRAVERHEGDDAVDAVRPRAARGAREEVDDPGLLEQPPGLDLDVPHPGGPAPAVTDLAGTTPQHGVL